MSLHIPYIEEVNDFTRQSHKKVRAVCALQVADKCPKEVCREYRDIMDILERNDGKYMCLYCSRKIKSTGRNNSNCKYKDLDDDFFSSIDSHFKAYLLGWIASDGSIKEEQINIEIKDIDTDIIEILRDNICKSLPISRRFNGTMNSVKLSISSNKIVSDVCGLLDIIPGKKSHTVKFPTSIPDNLKWHFIRGLFDGDGSIRKIQEHRHTRECSIASVSQHMKIEISDFCKIKNSINNGAIVYTGIDAMIFLSKMYNDSGIFKLSRKYTEYLKYIDYFGSTGS